MAKLFVDNRYPGDEWDMTGVIRMAERDGFFEAAPLDFADITPEIKERQALAIAFSEEAAEGFAKAGWAVVLALPEDADDRAAAADVSDADKESFAGAPYEADALMLGYDDIDLLWLRHVYERHYGIPRLILETERTIVRELALADLDDLYELYSQPSVTEFVEPLYDRKREEQYQRDYYKNVYGFYDYGMWGVFGKDSGRLIGRCGIDPHEYGPELGYIIHPAIQRQGIGHEVCNAIIGYARDELGLPELFLKAEPENKASVALAKKLGFKPLEGDFYILSLTADQY